MRETVDEQRKKLCELQGMVQNIKSFLIGPEPIKEGEETVKSVECFKDALEINSLAIDCILDIVKNIFKALDGGK